MPNYFGNGWADNITGSSTGDVILGYGGDDYLYGAAGGDVIEGEEGNDYLKGGLGQDTIKGENGDDLIMEGENSFAADAFRDVLLGNDGNDKIIVGYLDWADGGAGFDRLSLLLDTAPFGIEVDLSGIWAGVPYTMAGEDLKGFEAIDYIVASPWIDVIILGTPSGESATVYGMGGADVLVGGEGSDYIDGGSYTSAADAVHDELWGEGGNDLIVVGVGDYANGGLGYDQLYLSFGSSSVGVSLDLTTLATTGADTLAGSTELHYFDDIVEVIGSAFADTIDARAEVNGANLYGGSGADVLYASQGGGALSGEAGADLLIASAGNDYVSGGADIDIVDYGLAAAAVTVNLTLTSLQNTGGSGSDQLIDVENINGSAFGDVFIGNGFANSLAGAGGADSLNGAGGVDTLLGGAGDDILIGGAGADALDGGADYDSADYRSAAAAVSINLTTGTHTGDALGDTFASVERWMLTSLADSFVGSAAAERADGYNGDDNLQGGAGNDVLAGGAGNDVLDGGADSDTADYALAAAGVTLNLALATAQNTVGDGTDTLSNIENAIGSAFNDNLTGSTAANVLSGGAGADTLKGQGGDDALNGGDGDDALTGGAGADAFDGGAGTDWSDYRTATGAVSIDLTTGTHTGDALGDTFVSIERWLLSNYADTFTGTNADERVDAYDGNDTLNGGGGADTLGGLNGADILNGDDGDDILAGGVGGDALNGGLGTDMADYRAATAGLSIDLSTGTYTGDAAGDTYTSIERWLLSSFVDSFTGTGADERADGYDGDDVLSGGAGLDYLQGLNGADTLNGDDGNDTMLGGAGNDVLSGGNGFDKLYGDAGDDTLTGGADSTDQFIWQGAGNLGSDTITDFQDGLDKIRLVGTGATQFSDLTVTSNGAGWAVITLANGTQITVTGVAATDIDATDFYWI